MPKVEASCPGTSDEVSSVVVPIADSAEATRGETRGRDGVAGSEGFGACLGIGLRWKVRVSGTRVDSSERATWA